MSEAPETIWADIDDDYYGRGSMIGRVYATDLGDVEYIRADVSGARIADLERQLADLSKACRAGDMEAACGCQSPPQPERHPMTVTQPVAWKYRWKIDGEYVGWRYSDASNTHPSLDGFEEIPLYDADSIGDLIPKADAEMAVALAYQRAASRFPDGKTPWPPHAIRSAILALAPAEPLAEVQALKAWKRHWQGEIDVILAGRADEYDRAEAAEAEVARLRGCISMALRKMHPSGNLIAWNTLTSALTAPDKDATP